MADLVLFRFQRLQNSSINRCQGCTSSKADNNGKHGCCPSWSNSSVKSWRCTATSRWCYQRCN